MEQTGRLESWNDERGFGFIAPQGGGERIFVHINCLTRIATRPRVGDVVQFELGPGRGGRPAARRARIAGANPVIPTRRGEPVRPRPFGGREMRRLLLATLLTAVLLAGIGVAGLPALLGWAYLLLGAASLLAYGIDKRSAETDRWRVSEARLHRLDLGFGIIGGLAGQAVFGHKTAKRGFAATTSFIAMLHLAGLLLASAWRLGWV